MQCFMLRIYHKIEKKNEIMCFRASFLTIIWKFVEKCSKDTFVTIYFLKLDARQFYMCDFIDDPFCNFEKLLELL